MGRPARSGVFANAGARGQSRALATGFARNLAGAIVGPYTSLMSSCSFFPSSSSCPLLAWRLPLPSQPRAGLPASGSANPSDFTDIPARSSDTYLCSSAAAHVLTVLLEGEAVLTFCCSDSGRGSTTARRGGWKWCPRSFQADSPGC